MVSKLYGVPKHIGPSQQAIVLATRKVALGWARRRWGQIKDNDPAESIRALDAKIALLEQLQAPAPVVESHKQLQAMYRRWLEMGTAAFRADYIDACLKRWELTEEQMDVVTRLNLSPGDVIP